MKQTLLDKAHTAGGSLRDRRTKHPEAQLIQLAQAWLRGEIRNTQLTESLGRKPWAISGSITTVMNALRRAVVAGTVKLK